MFYWMLFFWVIMERKALEVDGNETEVETLSFKKFLRWDHFDKTKSKFELFLKNISVHVLRYSSSIKSKNSNTPPKSFRIKFAISEQKTEFNYRWWLISNFCAINRLRWNIANGSNLWNLLLIPIPIVNLDERA